MDIQQLHRDFPSRTFAKLQEWRRSMTFVDTLITCQSKTIGAHRAVLASTIPYFEKLFLPASSQQTKTVPLNELDPVCLADLIEFVYTGSLTITRDNIEGLIKTSHFLEMQEVKDSCVQTALSSLIDTNNCFGWKSLAVAIGDRQFADKCDEFMHRHIDSVVRSPQMSAVKQIEVELQLNVAHSSMDENKFHVQKTLPSIIQMLRHLAGSCSKNIALLSESAVCLTSSDGIGVSLTNEEEISRYSPCSSPKMFSARHLELNTTPKAPLESWKEIGIVQTAPTTFIVLASLSTTTVNLFISLLFTGDHSPSPVNVDTPRSLSASSDFMSSINESRCGGAVARAQDTIYIIGGYNRNGCLSTGEYYNVSTNRWCNTAEMVGRRGRCAAVSVSHTIYVMGGSDGQRELDTMEIYLPGINEWKVCQKPMIQSRSSFGAVAVEKDVYVLGGIQQFYSLSSVERYNVLDQKWHPVADMHIPRNDLTVAATENGSIYAIGGEQGPSGCTGTVERYDIRSSCWEMVAPLKQARRGACAVAFEDKIYVFGGCANAKALNSVEIYDPEEDTWSAGAPMMSPRSSLMGTTLGKQIMVIGGFDGTTFLNTAELYSPADDEWTAFV